MSEVDARQIEVEVPAEEAGERFDRFVAKAADISRQRAMSLLDEGKVRVGRRRVKKGERVTFRNSEGRGSYRITSFRDLAWTVVPETKVHRTVFA